MASFYPSEGDMLPTAYLLNQSCVPLSYQNLLSGGPPSSAQPESIASRDDTTFTPPPSVMSHAHMLSKQSVPSDGSAPIRQNYGLSLTLGCNDPLQSDLNSSLCSLLSSDMQSEVQLCRNNGGLKNVQYLSFDLAERSQDNMINRGTTFAPYQLHQAQEFVTGVISSSKYLKAAQDLLDEFVSVHRTSKLSEKVQNFGQDGGLTGTDAKRGEIHESTTNSNISPSERHDLQNKIAKLSDMLDEVNRRYRQYCHQMQLVASSFDALAGRGAAQPYMALALRTISCQFGALRDAIKKQVQATEKSLGEEDGNPRGVLTRLRNMEQQLRQQKAFGTMRQPWRPQRGLPENAVTVLRSWLFEHFLHPYPKDSEKIVLARQTGLTRSQVANWFINARVRLWKPMIEEMYKEEFGETEGEYKSSPEVATTTQETSTFDEMQSNEMMPDVISIDEDRAGLSYGNVAFQGW